MWKRCSKKGTVWAMEYNKREDLEGVFIPSGYTPQKGDMILKNSNNKKWLLNRELFDKRWAMSSGIIRVDK